MRQFGFLDIRSSKNTFNLVHFRRNSENEHWDQARICGLNVEDIDIMLSSEFHEELRIVRRMLTGSIPRMETNETQPAV